MPVKREQNSRTDIKDANALVSSEKIHFCQFLGAKAPLGPLDVKVKVKAKRLRYSMILLELLDDL